MGNPAEVEKRKEIRTRLKAGSDWRRLAARRTDQLSEISREDGRNRGYRRIRSKEDSIRVTWDHGIVDRRQLFRLSLSGEALGFELTRA